MDLLLIFACFYCAFMQVKTLVDHGSQPWELVHYLVLLLAIALTALGAWRSVYCFKEWRYKKAHPEEMNAGFEIPSSSKEEEPDEAEGEAEDSQAEEEDSSKVEKTDGSAD